MKYKPNPALKPSMGTGNIEQVRRKKVSGRLRRSKRTKQGTFEKLGIL